MFCDILYSCLRVCRKPYNCIQTVPGKQTSQMVRYLLHLELNVIAPRNDKMVMRVVLNYRYSVANFLGPLHCHGSKRNDGVGLYGRAISITDVIRIHHIRDWNMYRYLYITIIILH